MPPRRYVLDTNIYRYTSASPDFGGQLAEYRPNQMSVVVLCELWRAARTQGAQKQVQRIEQQMQRYTFAPSTHDWSRVSRYLSERLSLGRPPTEDALAAIRKEQDDALIALSSWSRGLAVVTCDKDFERIHTWAKEAAWKLVLIPAPAPPERPQTRT